VKNHFTFFSYLILSFILIAGGNEARYKKAVFLSKFVFYPFINSIEKINSLFDIREKNKILAEQLALQIQKSVALENRLDRLQSTSLQFETEYHDFIMADIIGYTGVFQERNLIIDKGTINNVKLNSPVISSVGIVGRIILTTLNYSVILPLNHTDFKLGVMGKRSHLQGILESDAYGNSYMNLLKLGSDIAVGDTIITSNISTIFPKGFPVGVITRLRETPDQVYMYAHLQTFIDPTGLDQVIVLNYQKEMNYESEIRSNRSK